MTDWKRSKTGLMAMEASMQLGGKRGSLRGEPTKPKAGGTSEESPWPGSALGQPLHQLPSRRPPVLEPGKGRPAPTSLEGREPGGQVHRLPLT